ncbi:FAD-dependent oxidoreductase [Streptomyces sp. NPDC001941]|uniref:NAD(P)/FAD-dependent oxidoreductase n=1 Tax=Streptomyces sp. NPDC001941 TaxID=3154659 RepID=UPI00331968FB
MSAERRRIAVVGGGVAGLTAAYVLQRSCDVTLYEADGRLGGHAHTHELSGELSGAQPSGADAALTRVDSGFIVHNDRTYPLLTRLFRELDVTVQDAEMSMSVRCDGCGLQYAGARGPGALFAGRRSLDPRYLRMLAEVPVFHRGARRLLRERGDADGRTLGRFLADGGFSPYFTSHFALPLVSCVWSCPSGTALDYPAAYLFRFLDHHGLLSVTGSPQWKTVTGGSARYVERIAKQLTAVRTDSPVSAVRRLSDGVRVSTAGGESDDYAGVVVAVHPDQALRLLADAGDAEREVLGAFRYSRNPTVLHTDPTLLPTRPRARASWNYLMSDCAAGDEGVRVTYDMGRLQRLPAPARYYVSLNATARVDPAKVLAEMVYEHPVYTPESVAAQRRLPELNTPVTAFAGAYHGWGFHEDGCRSGVAAAASLGVTW